MGRRQLNFLFFDFYSTYAMSFGCYVIFFVRFILFRVVEHIFVFGERALVGGHDVIIVVIEIVL